jgi:glycosyltransferase involved in cell wall biosynthesis
MTTHIVIPVRDQIHITQGIVEQIQQQSGWEKLWIFDNGSVDNTWEYLMDVNSKDPRICPINASGAGIYDMWDEGFRVARHDGADYIAILNNDLTLYPTTFERLNEALDNYSTAWIVYPDYNNTAACPTSVRVTSGTYRHGGMSGFIFMLRAGSIDWSPLVDPRFIWWGGDDDIAFEVESRGGVQLRVMGLPVEHFHEGTARHHDLGNQKGLDMQAIFNKWGR